MKSPASIPPAHVTLSSSNIFRRARGFTLIELLTVIAIIGILASLSFFGIRAARIKAKHVTCVGNLRACGQGFAMLLAENKGIYCGSGPDANGRIYRWMHRIGVYMDLPGPKTDRNSHEAGVGWVTTFDDAYRTPIFHSPFTDPKEYNVNALPNESMGIYGGNPNILTRNRHRGIPADTITWPGGTVLLAERYSGVWGNGSAIGAILDLTGAYPDKPLGPAANAQVNGSKSISGPCNFLFADFHVKAIKLETIDWSDINSTSPTGKIRYQP
ncbi:hypothetical protein OPIT5_12875 [Opitutaceae bacterium TAV5]|nr:hypothetical protein OPIT5_12875 [Opitutaceae bacterium TAV5]